MIAKVNVLRKLQVKSGEELTVLVMYYADLFRLTLIHLHFGAKVPLF